MSEASNMIPPPTNNLVTPLLTDLYQLTMAYGYWKTNKHEDHSVFELFFRKNPFKGEFTLFCGIDEALSFVKHFKFTESDIDYLRNSAALGQCEDAFFDDYLKNIDCSEVTVQALQQGSVAFPRVPLLIISGPLGICQLLETTLLNLVNFPSLVATNAARMVIAGKGQYGEGKVHNKTPKFAEFGLRRAQGPDGGFAASKYCMVGGFDATANVLTGKMLGVPIVGTHAHAFVQSHASLDEVQGLKVKDKTSGKDIDLTALVLEYRDKLGSKDKTYLDTNDGELAAFIAYGVSFPHAFLCLVDTYDTVKSGVRNFILVALALNDCGYTSRGVRLDSGDLASLSKKCHEMFEHIAKEFHLPFFGELDVVASNDINEEVLHQLNEQGHGITMFGIGTNLVTCQAQPALGCVYKLVQLNGKPRIKLSGDIVKVLIPGQKRAFRLFNEDDKPQMDLMIEINDAIPKKGQVTLCYDPFDKSEPVKFTPFRVEELLSTVWDKEKGCTIEYPTVAKAKTYAESQIRKLSPDIVRRVKPMPYKVCVSEKLKKELHALWEAGTKSSTKDKNCNTCICT